jgi:hypothetical protein
VRPAGEWDSPLGPAGIGGDPDLDALRVDPANRALVQARR